MEAIPHTASAFNLDLRHYDPIHRTLAQAAFDGLIGNHPDAPHLRLDAPHNNSYMGGTLITLHSPRAEAGIVARIDAHLHRAGIAPFAQLSSPERQEAVANHVPYIGLPSVRCLFGIDGTLQGVTGGGAAWGVNLMAIPEAAPIIAACTQAAHQG